MEDSRKLIDYKPTSKLLSFIREKTGRVNLYHYDTGFYKFKAFPPKRGFSDNDKSSLLAIAFHSSIIGDSTLNSQFKALKRLYITKDVSSISEHSFGNLELDVLEFASPDTYFSPNALGSLSTLKLVYDGNTYTNVSKYKDTQRGNALTHIRKDDDNRLSFEIGERLSLGEVDNFDRRNRSISLADYSKRAEFKAISEMLEGVDIKDGSSLFFYTRTSETSYGAQAIVDTYPLSTMRLSNPPDDKLVALYVNGVNEFNIDDLKRFPNVRQVFVSPTVKAVYGKTEKEKLVSYSDHQAIWSEIQNASGDPIKLVTMSKNTLMIPERNPSSAPSEEKSLGETSKEIEL